MYTPQSSLEKKAYALASAKHEGQRRKSGEPYFDHCVQTATILSIEWGITSPEILAAALAHDLIEDTDVTIEELAKATSPVVAKLVDGVTKFKKSTGETDDFATRQKIAAESYLDPRVAVLKLADRLHNMRTLGSLPPAKQFGKAEETLLLYAPLAESLGMWIVKTQLEDLAFPYINERLHESIKAEVQADPRLTPQFLKEFVNVIKKELSKNKIKGEIVLQKNGLWALWRKREKTAFKKESSRSSFAHINDLVSVRVITKTIPDCYLALGAIHVHFDGMIETDRFDEFIVSPRNNGYRALQTTVNTEGGSVEIAIATADFENFNNWGVVSVLSQKGANAASYSRKIVFTPGNHVWYVPREATALDLAYLINPALGRDALGVMVNGQRSALSLVIPNASTVVFEVGGERVTRGEESLTALTLPSSKALLLEELALAEWEETVREGKRLVERQLLSDKRGIFDLFDLERTVLIPLLTANGCKGLSDLHYKLGIGNVAFSEVGDFLDKLGLVRDNPDQSGFSIVGHKSKDEPGILAHITSVIAKSGGSILFLDNTYDAKGNFRIQILLRNLTKQATEKLYADLKSDTHFSEVICV